MELLRHRGLFGKGLLKVSSEAMVERYNNALEHMGLPPTSLKQFSVDMLGWSPEIASEQDNTYYLTRDIANPVAIIININQKHASIYFPYHSFDRPMIESFFDEFANQIMEINTTDALCIDLDNGVSFYSDINDLLLVKSFTMKVDTPTHLIAGAQRQNELVKDLLESDSLWEDKAVRDELLESGKTYGDLRNRNVVIPPLEYGHLKIFYSEASGGVYVLNNPPGVVAKETIIIYRDEKVLESNKSKNKHVRFESLYDPNLLSKLMGSKYLQFDIESYKTDPTALDRKKEIILANYICEHEKSYYDWPQLKKKNYIAKHAANIPELFFEIERLQKQLRDNVNVDISSFSTLLTAHLMEPHSRISNHYHYALNRILSSILVDDPIKLFQYNKNMFYKEYSDYTECKKNWIVEYLNRNN